MQNIPEIKEVHETKVNVNVNDTYHMREQEKNLDWLDDRAFIHLEYDHCYEYNAPLDEEEWNDVKELSADMGLDISSLIKWCSDPQMTYGVFVDLDSRTMQGVMTRVVFDANHYRKG